MLTNAGRSVHWGGTAVLAATGMFGGRVTDDPLPTRPFEACPFSPLLAASEKYGTQIAGIYIRPAFRAAPNMVDC